MRSWPLLVLAAPAAAEVWSGWVGIAQKTGFGLVSPLPGIWPSLHLDTTITLPVGVEAYAAYALRAWLASDHAISARTRRFAKWSAICSFALGMAGQVAYHLLAQAGVARAPWADHHHRVLPAGPGPGHGDRAGPHAPRRRRTADAPDSRTAGPAMLRSPAWSPTDQAGPDPDQAASRGTLAGIQSPGRDQNVRGSGPQHDRQDHETCATGRAAGDGPGPPYRPQVRRIREAGITAGIAQRRSQGLQRGPERTGAHGQRRTSRHSRVARPRNDAARPIGQEEAQ